MKRDGWIVSISSLAAAVSTGMTAEVSPSRAEFLRPQAELHSESEYMRQIVAATPSTLGAAAGGAEASCAVAALDEHSWVVLWLDRDGRMVARAGEAESPTAAAQAVKLDSAGVGDRYVALSLAGGERAGWWLAARDRAGKWSVWRKAEWSGAWSRIADPGAALSQTWRYCPGVIAVDDGLLMPVLVDGADTDKPTLVWLKADSSGQWRRLNTSMGNANVPPEGFRLGRSDGALVTIDSATGEAVSWKFGRDAAAQPAEGPWPRAVLAWRSAVVLRSGVRIPGVKPSFPSAGLVISTKEGAEWIDLGYADETPDKPVAAASLAVRSGTAIAAYVHDGADTGAECRLVQVPVAQERLDRSSGWRQLPPYPLEPGVAGIIAGTHNGVIIAAGGANWEGQTKVWHDEIFVLVPGEDAWRRAGRLPQLRGYSAAVSVPGGVLVAGGDNATKVFQDAFMMRWDGREVRITPLPPLPEPATSPVAEFLDGSVYLAGGYNAEKPRSSRSEFWRLDLADTDRGWQSLPSWSGPSRGQAVMAALDGAIYLFSGLETGPGTDGNVRTTYLNDAHRYRPGRRAWERLPDLPWSALAAPSPAPTTTSPARVFVLGGVDGRQAGLLPRDTLLPADILYFDVAQHRWKLWPEAWPDSVVTVPAIRVGEEWIIPSGEIKSMGRTTHVWSWRIDKTPHVLTGERP